MYNKVISGHLPAYAGVGNNPSSSSAMAIAPDGNFERGRSPTRGARDLRSGGPIHSGPEITFCRDAACGMAAAVAEALKPDVTVESVLLAAVRYLHIQSAREIRCCCEEVLALARETVEYQRFARHSTPRVWQPLIADSRETFPATLALLALSEATSAGAVTMGANFGRDADTIAGMIGGLAGALCGASAIPPEWVERVETAGVDYQSMAERFAP